MRSGAQCGDPSGHRPRAVTPTLCLQLQAGAAGAGDRHLGPTCRAAAAAATPGDAGRRSPEGRPGGDSAASGARPAGVGRGVRGGDRGSQSCRDARAWGQAAGEPAGSPPLALLPSFPPAAHLTATRTELSSATPNMPAATRVSARGRALRAGCCCCCCCGGGGGGGGGGGEDSALRSSHVGRLNGKVAAPRRGRGR